MTKFDELIKDGPEKIIEIIVGDRHPEPIRETLKEKWREYFNSPAKPTLTEGEKEFVRWALDFGFKWAAKDEYGTIGVYSSKPKKDWDIGQWIVKSSMRDALYRGPLQINFIQWGDDEPVYLPDFVEGSK
jgi:hypothetical protein